MTRVKLYHHPDCARCERFARVHRRLNWLGWLEVSTATPPTGPLPLGAIAAEDVRTGQTVLGVRAARWAFAAIPAYWPLLPLLYVPFVARRVDRAARGCEDGSCAVPGGAGVEVRS
jgi:hypothetical protein